jgi:hypothetical protein
MLNVGFLKSKRERELEEKRAVREAFRKAERANERLLDDANRLKSERSQAWLDAKSCLSNGDKGGAQRHLQSIQAVEMHIAQIDKRRWSVDRIITKLRMSRADEEVMGAIKRLSDCMRIEPERLDAVIADVSEKFEDQQETNRIWESAHASEVAGLEARGDAVPSLDAMMKSLEQEVAVDVRVGTERQSKELEQEIEAGRQRLKDLLEESK